MINKIKDLFSKKNNSVFIIAEIGSNHGNDINIAKKLIRISKKAGVDAVKFQSFKAATLYSKYVPRKKLPNGKRGPNIYKMIEDIEMPYDWHAKLKSYCDKIGIIFISSPFDEEALISLEKSKCLLYKIASSEIGDINLVTKVAETNKPIIISTGKASLSEVKRAIKWIENTGNRRIIILHCTATYPATYSSMNLNNILTLKKNFNYKIGLSDHNTENLTSAIAVSLGAKVIEKHITLNKNSKGPDHHFALEPNELINLVEFIRNTEKSLGSFEKKIDFSEIQNRKIGNRSIHAAKDFKPGDKIKKSDLVFKRPNLGIEPHLYKKIIGKKIKKRIKKDMWLKWNDIEK